MVGSTAMNIKAAQTPQTTRYFPAYRPYSSAMPPSSSADLVRKSSPRTTGRNSRNSVMSWGHLLLCRNPMHSQTESVEYIPSCLARFSELRLTL